MAGQTVVVSVLADTRNFNRNLLGTETALSRFSRSVGNISTAIGSLFVGGAFAIGAGGLYLVGLGEDALETDRKLRQLIDNTDKFDASLDAVIGRLQGVATSTQRLIGVDDDLVKSVQSQLVPFSTLSDTLGIAGGAFDRTTMLAFDMAEALGTEPVDAAKTLGRALEDPIAGMSRLSRQGVIFSETTRQQVEDLVAIGDIAGAQAVLLAELEGRYGGVAAEGARATDKLRTAWENLLEEIGVAILPIVEPELKEFTELLYDVIDDPAFKNFTDNLGELFADLIRNLPEVAKLIADAFDWFTDPKNQKLIQDVLIAIVSIPAAIKTLDASINTFRVISAILQGIIAFGTTVAGIFATIGSIFSAGGVQAAATTALQEFVDGNISLDEMLNKIPESTKKNTDAFKNFLKYVVPLANFFKSLPSAIAGAITAIGNVAKGIGTFLGALGKTPTIVGVVITAITVLIGWFSFLGGLLFGGANNVVTYFTTVFERVSGFLAKVGEFLGLLGLAIGKVFSDIGASIASFVEENLPWLADIYNGAVEVFTNVIDFLAGLPGELFNLGADIGNGLFEGLQSIVNGIYDWLEGIVDGWIDGLENFLGIASPSKVFKGIGKNIGLGLASGIDASIPTIDRAFSKMETSVGGFTSELNVGQRDVSSTGNTYQINVQAISPNAEVGRAVVKAISDYERFNGKRVLA